MPRARFSARRNVRGEQGELNECCEELESEWIELVSEAADDVQSYCEHVMRRVEMGDVGGNRADGAVLSRGSERPIVQ
jgi:hypothetical protein